MRIGIMNDPWTGTLTDMRDEVAWAARSGADTYWLAQVWRYDAFTLIPSLAADAPGLQFATGVAATFHRHPMTMASQALTANLLTGGRFTLGIGLMHKPIIEGMFGMVFDRPVRHMSEYLDVLLPLLAQDPSEASGEVWTYRGPIDVPGAPECPVLLAALGSQMLDLCGRRTAGTITWMTGPRTIRDHVVPTITSAAERVGRESPRVVALVPVHVTDNAAAARALAAQALGGYGTMPSYRAMLDREGLAGPEDFAIIGTEQAVADELDAYRAAGVTDLGITIAADDIDRVSHARVRRAIHRRHCVIPSAPKRQPHQFVQEPRPSDRLGSGDTGAFPAPADSGITPTSARPLPGAPHRSRAKRAGGALYRRPRDVVDPAGRATRKVGGFTVHE